MRNMICYKTNIYCTLTKWEHLDGTVKILDISQPLKFTHMIPVPYRYPEDCSMETIVKEILHNIKVAELQKIDGCYFFINNNKIIATIIRVLDNDIYLEGV